MRKIRIPSLFLREGILCSDASPNTGYFASNIFLTCVNVLLGSATLVPGYLPEKKFIDLLTFIGEDRYQTMNWEEYLAKFRS